MGWRDTCTQAAASALWCGVVLGPSHDQVARDGVVVAWVGKIKHAGLSKTDVFIVFYILH